MQVVKTMVRERCLRPGRNLVLIPHQKKGSGRCCWSSTGWKPWSPLRALTEVVAPPALRDFTFRNHSGDVFATPVLVFTCIKSLNHHNDPIKWIVYPSSLVDIGTERQSDLPTVKQPVSDRAGIARGQA